MTVSDELKRTLHLKTILLDTGVLSMIKNNITSHDVQDFLGLLGEIKCQASVHDLIRVEFLRDANRQIEFAERKKLIDELCVKFSLPVPEQIYRDAVTLSYIYVRHQHRGVGFVDLMSSAVLKTYSRNDGLVFVTKNHKDFPLLIHDRVGTIVIDLGKTLDTLGFYRINLDKWNQEVKNLLASTEWNVQEA